MIHGNVTGTFKRKVGTEKNAIGEVVPTWNDFLTVKGFLDYMSGDSKHTVYDAKIQESTHVFLCDYVSISEPAEKCRMVINGKTYEVLLIDNPMELDQHLEIYLKYTGR